MQQSPFYNATIKNLLVAFGNLFSGLTIVRTGTGSGSGVSQTVAVPLSFSNKEKWVQRIQQQPDVDAATVYATLPRMAFEMTGMGYDASRKLQPLNRVQGTPNSTFTPVPYNVNLNLYILSKNQEDALQIVEQILPAFAPAYTVTINGGASGSGGTQQVPIVLNSVSTQDEFEGSMDDRRLVTWTLSFTAKISLYGGGSAIGTIQTVHVYINDPAHINTAADTPPPLPVADYTATATGSGSGAVVTESWIESI